MSATPETAAAERWRRARDLFDRLVELAPDGRAAGLAAEADRALAAEVEALLAAHDGGGRRLEEPVWQEALGAADAEAGGELAPGTRLGPWEIEGIAGRGGMGVVYRARRADGAFERAVAIKLVRGAHDTGALTTRLEEERRLLAPLDHPGIAGLIDAGSTPGGLPFLVLEYVDGAPIDAWCEARALDLAGRLELFLAVCEAVEHAHERLVLHRDLKPSNILVDGEGQPHLLDFGIAKLLDPATGHERGATLTRAGFRALSLDYASPEQLRGEPLGTASDVFSLGVVLYRLLTGRLPFAGDTDWPEARAAKVATGVFEAPSAVARRAGTGLPWKRLRGDLDAIVARALAAGRTERYGTVRELADDLRRHLDGRPVRARRPSAVYRFRRFVARHRLAVSAGLAVAIALGGAAAFSLRQAAMARHERDRARERFEDVRRLAKVFLFDVHDAIAPLPGATAARELLARTGADYLDRLARDAGGEPELQLELAGGFERLAEIRGRPWGANLGDAPAALAAYQRARALYEGLAAEGYPSPAAAAEALARVDLATAESRFAVGEVPAALAAAAAGLARLEPAAPADGPERRLLRARLRARLGFLTGGAGELERGAARIAEAIDDLERLARERPGDRQVRRHLARAHSDHGALVGNTGAPGALDQALASFERALALDLQLAREDPADLDVRRGLVRDHLMVGAAHAMAGRHEPALGVFAEGARLTAAMAAADPSDLETARAAATLATRQALALIDLGRPGEALVVLTGAEERLAGPAARHPENVRLAVTLAETVAAAAEAGERLAGSPGLPASERRRHRGAACADYSRAAPLLEDLLARGILAATEEATARAVLARRAAYCPPASG